MSRRTCVALALLVVMTACSGAPQRASRDASVDHTRPVAHRAPVWLRNGGFEASTEHWWGSWGARLSRVAAVPGGGVAQLERRGGGRTFQMTSDPSKAEVGGPHILYSAGVRVRSAGRRGHFSLQVREVGANGRLVGSGTARVPLTHPGWRHVALRYLSRSQGTRLSVRLAGHGIARGGSFQVDDVTLQPSQTCRVIDYQQPSQGRLAWHDEFAGTSVDSGRWTVRDHEELSSDAAYLLARNVTESGGLLRMTARRESAGGRQFTSGYLDTKTTFTQRYGFWEMRAKSPTWLGTSRGLWPAFWLRASRDNGEADVMEALGDPSDRSDYRRGSYWWTLHHDTYQPSAGKISGWGTAVGSPPISDGYHRYGFNWSPTCMTWWFDGRIVGSVPASRVAWYDSSFHSPVNIRLNLAVGNSWSGFPAPRSSSASTFPATFLVDYVRVYAPRTGLRG